jgi:hypothetical protein
LSSNQDTRSSLRTTAPRSRNTFCQILSPFLPRLGPLFVLRKEGLQRCLPFLACTSSSILYMLSGLPHTYASFPGREGLALPPEWIRVALLLSSFARVSHPSIALLWRYLSLLMSALWRICSPALLVQEASVPPLSVAMLVVLLAALSFLRESSPALLFWSL